VHEFHLGGDFSAAWQTGVEGDIFADVPSQDVWWYGGDNSQPGVVIQCPVSSTRVVGDMVVTPSSTDLILDWQTPQYTIGASGDYNWGAVIVLNSRHLSLGSDGTYNFQSLYVGDNAIFEFATDALTSNNGQVELLAVEDIVFGNNVKFVGFGQASATPPYTGFLYLLYAADTYNGRLTRGVELLNAPISNTQQLYINYIASNGDVNIGHRQNIIGCAAADRYLNIQNFVTFTDPTAQ